jgi:hypothetical protein
VEQSAARGPRAQAQAWVDDLGGRSLAALGAVVALLAYSAWLVYAGQGGYADGHVPDFPYQALCLIVAVLAIVAALVPGRRRLCLAALVGALCLTGAVLVLYFALDSLMPLGFAGLTLLTTLPLACAAALFWRGEAQADRRQAPSLAVALVAAGGLVALAGGALSGGLLPGFLLAGVGALSAAGVMRSRSLLGSVGALLCLLPLAGAAYAKSGLLSSSPAEVALACVPSAGLLVAGALLARHSAGMQDG